MTSHGPDKRPSCPPLPNPNPTHLPLPPSVWNYFPQLRSLTFSVIGGINIKVSDLPAQVSDCRRKKENSGGVLWPQLQRCSVQLTLFPLVPGPENTKYTPCLQNHVFPKLNTFLVYFSVSCVFQKLGTSSFNLVCQHQHQKKKKKKLLKHTVGLCSAPSFTCGQSLIPAGNKSAEEKSGKCKSPRQNADSLKIIPSLCL